MAYFSHSARTARAQRAHSARYAPIAFLILLQAPYNHFGICRGGGGGLCDITSAFPEPSSWCVGAVLNVAWYAVCASAAPSSWRIEDVLVVAGVV